MGASATPCGRARPESVDATSRLRVVCCMPAAPAGPRRFRCGVASPYRHDLPSPQCRDGTARAFPRIVWRDRACGDRLSRDGVHEKFSIDVFLSYASHFEIATHALCSPNAGSSSVRSLTRIETRYFHATNR
jgi:hypothetical protein